MAKIKWFGSIRAFGLLLVLGYHLFYNLLPSGFVGVDIFFAFSGFLITAHIMEEVRETHKFGLFVFYKRRAKRILAPLFLSVVFTLPFALVISPDFTVSISKQLASVLSFTSNWFYIITNTSYEAQLLPQLYVHTWSLSILMQLYLAWGAICALLVVASKQLSKQLIKKFDHDPHYFFRFLIIAVSAVFAICSFVYMVFSYNAESNPNAVYFNTFSRSFPFFIGICAAAVWGINPQQDAALK